MDTTKEWNGRKLFEIQEDGFSAIYKIEKIMVKYRVWNEVYNKWGWKEDGEWTSEDLQRTQELHEELMRFCDEADSYKLAHGLITPDDLICTWEKKNGKRVYTKTLS